jgi:hypothetical protein
MGTHFEAVEDVKGGKFMSCEIRSEEHTDRLLAYAAGKLRGEAAAKLELHMRSCKECEGFGQSQSHVWNLLDSWEARPVSADFNRQLYARIDAAASASWLERLGASVSDFLRPVFARPAFPLAAASLVIAAGFLLDHPGRSFSPIAKSSELHASNLGSIQVDGNKMDLEVDQVESTLDDLEMLRQFDAKQDEGAKENSSKSM